MCAFKTEVAKFQDIENNFFGKNISVGDYVRLKKMSLIFQYTVAKNRLLVTIKSAHIGQSITSHTNADYIQPKYMR